MPLCQKTTYKYTNLLNFFVVSVLFRDSFRYETIRKIFTPAIKLFIFISIIASLYNYPEGWSGRWYKAVLLCSAPLHCTCKSQAEVLGEPAEHLRMGDAVCPRVCVTFARGAQECFRSHLRVSGNSAKKTSAQKTEGPYEPEKGRFEGILGYYMDAMHLRICRQNTNTLEDKF